MFLKETFNALVCLRLFFLFLLVATILVSKASFVAVVAPLFAGAVFVNAVAAPLWLQEPAWGQPCKKRWGARGGQSSGNAFNVVLCCLPALVRLDELIHYRLSRLLFEMLLSKIVHVVVILFRVFACCS